MTSLERGPRLVRVCSTDELRSGERRLLIVGRRTIGVLNVDGRYFAFLNRCPHAGAPLCLGRVTGMVEANGPGFDVTWTRAGEILRCPWHAWEFELESGRSISNPRIRATTYPVVIEEGDVFVQVSR